MGQEGKVVKRHGSIDTPEKIDKDIAALLYAKSASRRHLQGPLNRALLLYAVRKYPKVEITGNTGGRLWETAAKN